MNRWDEIQGLARDIASNVHADPVKRDAMADDLIKLCGAMIGAVGKAVAIDGESSVSDGEDDSAHARYLVGERVQDGAREAVDSATNPKVDLDRWTRPSPGDGCRCGHVPSVHEDGVCNGEGFNGVACHGGPCRGFVRKEPTGGWRHIDRRPAALQSSATPGAPIELGNPEPVNLDGFGATPFPTFHGTVVAPRRCCYAVSGPCATCRNGRPVGGCCFPLGQVCPSHH